MSASAKHSRFSCRARPPGRADLTETEQCPAQKADERFWKTMLAIRDMRLEKDFAAALSLVEGLGLQLRQEQLDLTAAETGVVKP